MQGLETDHPILQIDQMLFEGSYVETLGTNMLFSQSTSNQLSTRYLPLLGSKAIQTNTASKKELDEAGEPTKLDHECNVTRKLVFRAISVAPKRSTQK